MKLVVLLLLLFSLVADAKGNSQNNTSYEMEDYIVYYNVFNSTMILPQVARAHNLIRAKNRVYVNVSLVKKTGGNGIPAKISGRHRNLIQQSFELNFIEIRESTATYYLAPIRFNNEEILHIDITATPLDESETAKFTITKKLYQD